MTQAINKQQSRDMRIIDISVTDYISEVPNKLFIFMCEQDATVAFKNQDTNETIIWSCIAQKEYCFQTDTIYKVGTDAGKKIIAIY